MKVYKMKEIPLARDFTKFIKCVVVGLLTTLKVKHVSRLKYSIESIVKIVERSQCR